jgi:hypothetical protein
MYLTFIHTTLISTSLSRISVGEDLLEELRILSFAHVRMAPENDNKRTLQKEIINALDSSDKMDFPRRFLVKL